MISDEFEAIKQQIMQRTSPVVNVKLNKSSGVGEEINYELEVDQDCIYDCYDEDGDCIEEKVVGETEIDEPQICELSQNHLEEFLKMQSSVKVTNL